MKKQELKQLIKEAIRGFTNDIKVGDTCAVDMGIVKKHDSISPYIKLVNTVIKNGDGTVYVSDIDINGGLAYIRAWKNDVLGDVRVPISSLHVVGESSMRNLGKSKSSKETGEYSHAPQMRVGSNENPDLFESGGVVHVISKPVKDTSTGELVVKWMTNGKRDERKTYYTDDLKDAQDTALQMQKHASEMNKKSLSEGDFNLEKKELMTRHSLDATPNKQVTDLSPDRAPKDEPINESAKDKLKRIIIEVLGEQHFNVGDRVKAEIYGKIVKCDGGFITIQTDAGDEVSMLPPPDNKVEKLEF